MNKPTSGSASFDLSNKVALVTGALGLLGREHCKALYDAGARVVIADLNVKSAEDFAATLGDRAMALELNVVDPVSVKSGLDSVLTRHKQLDVLVNNAAINDMFENPTVAAELSAFEKYPLDLWKKMMDVNVTGTFLCSQIMGGEMARAGRGSIINVASTYGMVGPDQSIYIRPNGERVLYKSPAYPASKGAVISFTRFLAAYWGKAGVRVNTLSPGGVENSQETFFVENYSKRTPLGRMANPSDYRGAVVFLASDASSYMTGANLVVDGGWTAW